MSAIYWNISTLPNMTFGVEGGFLRKSTNINEINDSRRYHASEPLTRMTFESKKENVEKNGVHALHNVFITFLLHS